MRVLLGGKDGNEACAVGELEKRLDEVQCRCMLSTSLLVHDIIITNITNTCPPRPDGHAAAHFARNQEAAVERGARCVDDGFQGVHALNCLLF